MDLCPFMDLSPSDKHSDKYLNIKGPQYNKKQISSKGKYINLQSMIRKIFGPIKHMVTGVQSFLYI